MKFLKFTILNHNETLQTDESASILINSDHIVSIKPIKMTTSNRDIIDGHWLRLTNGKKYKTTQMPQEIKDLFLEQLPKVDINSDNVQDSHLQ
jgi:hypothetical protein